MSKKNLPDSLELLLDTMCNTFGGIMFIAISLIVMSQLISQQQKAMTREEISKAVIEKMKNNIEALLQENAKLSQLALIVSINTGNVSPEKKDAVMRLKNAKEKNLKLEDNVERLKTKIAINTDESMRLDETLKKLSEELESSRKKIEVEKEQIQKEKELLVQKIKKLEDELKNLRPKTLRFAKVRATEKSPYWVLIQRNKIYRLGNERFPLKGEVEPIYSKYRNKVWLKTIRGTEIGDDPEAVLSFLFKGVDKERYYIKILSDVESFSTLMVTRQYARNNRFLNDWSITQSFELGVSNNVTHSASE